jgi:hypothetical protein
MIGTELLQRMVFRSRLAGASWISCLSSRRGALAAQGHQAQNLGTAAGTDPGDARGGFDNMQIFFGGLEKLLTSRQGIEQLLVKEGVPSEDEEIAHEAHHQPSGTAGNALAAQFFKVFPHRRAKEQLNDQFIVGGGEIVGNFPIVFLVHGVFSMVISEVLVAKQSLCLPFLAMFASIFGKSVRGRKALPSGAIEGKKPVLHQFCPFFSAINRSFRR